MIPFFMRHDWTYSDYQKSKKRTNTQGTFTHSWTYLLRVVSSQHVRGETKRLDHKAKPMKASQVRGQISPSGFNIGMLPIPSEQIGSCKLNWSS